jgi:hypothetical protein
MDMVLDLMYFKYGRFKGARTARVVSAKRTAGAPP